jgi:hypothetical protein
MLKKSLTRLLTIFLLFSFVIMGACSKSGGGKAMCEANGTYKKYNHKKGPSGYSKKYGYKGAPTRKDYVIKNGRKPIVP